VSAAGAAPWAEVRRGALSRRFALWCAVGAAAVLALDTAMDRARLLWTGAIGLGFLVGLPLIMTAAVAVACAAVGAATAALALAGKILAPSRPTGIGALWRELCRLPAGLLPRYAAALRRARNLPMWGAITGAAAAWIGCCVHSALGG